MNKWLSSSALKILGHVRERKSISFYNRELHLASAGSSKIINELVTRGLIEKKTVGRECRISLTVRGQIAQEQLWALNRLLG